jgi:hypothetical protein
LNLPTFGRSDLAIIRSRKLLWCSSLEERHGKEDQESTTNNHDIARTESLRARVRGKACKASHSRTQQRPAGINASQEENARGWEMSDCR